jgi:hypothetical protein
MVWTISLCPRRDYTAAMPHQMIYEFLKRIGPLGKEAFGPAYWSNWILAALAFWAGWLALKNLREIKRQVDLMNQQTLVAIASAEAARVSADAALLNAQAVINAERALLLFTVEKEKLSGLGGPSIFHINIVNYGKVPARRLEISNPFHAIMPLDDFIATSPPDYGEDLQEVQEWLAPKESRRVVTFCPYEKRREIMAAAQSLGVEYLMVKAIIYGQVTYHDGISLKERHSRYCYAHERVPFSNIGGSVTPVGPKEYLECT